MLPPGLLAAAPAVATRAALVVLDLQADFVEADSAVVGRCVALAARLRRAAVQVVWVRTAFGSPRAACDPAAGALLVEDSESESESESSSENEDTKDERARNNDAVLAAPCALAGEFVPAVQEAIAAGDTVHVKTHYSALQTPALLRACRAQLVTTLYLAGALSHVSVHATAVDAARHGFAVVLVADCLAFASPARHRAALARMHGLLGIAGVPAAEIMREEEEEEEKEEQNNNQDQTALAQALAGLGLDDTTTTTTTYGAGDSRLVTGLALDAAAFATLRQETAWQPMRHRAGPVPRLVAVQAVPDAATGGVPLYRHPADALPPVQQPFSPAVAAIARVVEGVLGHPVNHALLQRYRSPADAIADHADKTLDMAPGSSVANVSLGAERVLVLRPKPVPAAGTEHARRPPAQRVPLPHNSVFVLGPATNRAWQHAVRPDRRPPHVKTPAERACGGERVSLTFRRIATFTHPTTHAIWGQGATAKSPAHAQPAVHGPSDAADRLVRAFGRENRHADFDWAAEYGAGFDVVNLGGEHTEASDQG
ncbi:hypothetical protein LOZ58_004169 [Ophidiomyces ophidiicola]|nr:hypothetical protein LOZ58_004169 [Ophidiomyces ophidiicola]